MTTPTSISTKFAAFAFALLANGLIMGGVLVLFNGKLAHAGHLVTACETTCGAAHAPRA